MEFLKPYLAESVLGLGVLVVVLVLMVLNANARLVRTQRLVRGLLSGPGGEDLEGMLKRCLSESRQSLARCDEQEKNLAELSDTVRGCLQQVGLVRYDAFGDVSGSQSFSLALLDKHGNGSIVTSLLGRNDGRCFGKAVFGGQTEQALSDEESQALQMAISGRFGSEGFGSGDIRLPEKGNRRDRGSAGRGG